MLISRSIRFDSWEFAQSAHQGGGSMTAESPLNAVEPAEESTVEPVNRASWQTSTLVRQEIARRPRPLVFEFEIGGGGPVVHRKLRRMFGGGIRFPEDDGERLVCWFRGGIGVGRVGTSGPADNVKTSATFWLFSADALFTVTPFNHFDFYVGPQVNLSFSGSSSATDGNGVETSVSASFRTIGIGTGLFGYIDL